MSKLKINWPQWDKVLNKRFVPLIDNQDRYLLLWGGRGSSKSVFAAKKLIYRCLTEPYFRYLLIRKRYNSIKDSQYQTIKDIITDMGLSSLFTFKISPMEITCINGNKFIARGCDDTTKLKSIKDPTGAWYEEDIIDESDFITITTSIRTAKASYLQEIFTFNPEVEGDYTENWFWKKYFSGRDDLNFSDNIMIDVNGEAQQAYTYTSHHSTYVDNKWLPKEFMAFLQSMKETNPYYYTIYCLGKWGNKVSTGQFYKLFSYAKNTADSTYHSHLPLHISFDFNVNPYITCTVWQVQGKHALQIDELCLSSPYNTTSAVCREFIRRYPGHGAGLFIYGDPAGQHEDTRNGKGFNDYTIIRRELVQYQPSLRVQKAAPPVVARGNFINTLFHSGYDGVEILVGYNCTHSLNDYIHLKEASDGTKAKEKVKNADTNVVCEKYGHTSDANDYFLTTAFANEFARYQRGGADMKITTGKNFLKHAY